MTIIGVAGAIGSGKSFTQLKHGLKYIEERQKQLVTNFPINVDELRKYASFPREYQSLSGYICYELKKVIYALKFNFYRTFPKVLKEPKKPKLTPHLPWVKRLCEKGGIIQIPAPDILEALLIPDSVVLLDEAGILLNSREFAKTSKQLLADLAQSRKDGCDLIWCAQFDEQVDRQMRMLTQFWIHCESISTFDKKMRRPKLRYKRIFWFRCNDYVEWQRNTSVRGNHIKTRVIYASVYEGGLLTKADRQLFNIFDSFKRLDKKYGGSQINSFHQCHLPRDYYFQRLSDYTPEKDCFSKSYQPDLFNPVVTSSWKKQLKDYEAQLGSKETVARVSTAQLGSKQSRSSHGFTKKSKSALIREALNLSRELGIRAPYFKDMEIEEIQSFIVQNQNKSLR